MISSGEEFELLLKKWQSESTKVGVLVVVPEPTSKPRANCLIAGTIRMIYEEKKAFMVATKNDDTVFAHYSDCTFRYGTDAEHEIKQFANTLTGGRFDELVLLTSPVGVIVAVFPFK
jgi:hypothetical protein